MTQLLTPPPKVIMNAAETADHLAKALGGKSSHWAIWLANDRKPSRVNRCLPQEPGPGRPRYSAAMVDAYIADYKRTRPTGKTGNEAGASKGRQFAAHIAALTLAEGADQAAVLLVIPKPLASFMLSPEEARKIAARLIKAADEIDAEVSEPSELPS